MQVLSFLKNGKRYDITAEALEILRKGAAEMSKDWDESKHPREKGKFTSGGGSEQGSATEAKTDIGIKTKEKIKEWQHIERPVLGHSKEGNWLYQRLLHNIKAKQSLGQSQMQRA
jgi:hypothetical protein